MNSDRRRFPRYLVKRNTFFVFNHFSTRVGSVRDISEDGVSFEFNHKVDTEFSPEVIDMFSLNNGCCYMAGVGCKAIYSLFYDGQTEDVQKGYRLCRCGVQFFSLDSGQKEQLKTIVQSGA